MGFRIAISLDRMLLALLPRAHHRVSPPCNGMKWEFNDAEDTAI